MPKKCEEPYNELTVSEIQITPIKQQKSLVAFASFVLNRQIYCGGVAIHTDLKNQSFRLVFPTKKFSNGEEVPLFHPIDKSTYEQIRKAVVSEFEKLREK